MLTAPMLQALAAQFSHLGLGLGHVLGVGLQTSTNDAGGKVLEMLTDYQGLPNGGDGWLRTLKFIPGENSIQVITYSPLLDKYNKAANEAFSIDYQMTSGK